MLKPDISCPGLAGDTLGSCIFGLEWVVSHGLLGVVGTFSQSHQGGVLVCSCQASRAQAGLWSHLGLATLDWVGVVSHIGQGGVLVCSSQTSRAKA